MLKEKERKKAEKKASKAAKAAEEAEKNRLEQIEIATDIEKRLETSKSAGDPGAKLLVWIKDPPFKCDSTELKVSTQVDVIQS